MIRHGFEGPKRTTGVGSGFVLDNAVTIGLDAIATKSIQLVCDSLDRQNRSNSDQQYQGILRDED